VARSGCFRSGATPRSRWRHLRRSGALDPLPSWSDPGPLGWGCAQR
jgi:hypothetical protein